VVYNFVPYDTLSVKVCIHQQECPNLSLVDSSISFSKLKDALI
jgi:hypothetical protein